MSNHSDKVFFVDWLNVFLVAEMNQLNCLIEEYDFIVWPILLSYWLYRILAFFMNISASFGVMKYS